MRAIVPLIAFCWILAVFVPVTGTLAEEKESTVENGKTQQVIAEGVGATADEAIKDAYRNAVRQVVGAVVDAETLIENDEIIDDKVLTYSDGFIKTYEEVAGSKKVQGGLHRIKIKAQVERRSVIAKLKAANVTMKDVDGKGLFAEAMTKLVAEKDAAALLKKQFEGFPQSCFTATIVGEPQVVPKTDQNVSYKLTVQIEPDLKAYKAFANRLVSVLDKLAKAKGEYTAEYETVPRGSNSIVRTNSAGSGPEVRYFVQMMPKLMVKDREYLIFNQERISVAVATNRTKAANSIDYKYFALDASLRPILIEVASRAGQCKIQVLDAGGESVATDRFDLDKLIADGCGTPVAAYWQSQVGVINRQPRNSTYFSHGRTDIVIISPVLGDMFVFQTMFTISRSLTLSLEELKSLKKATVELTFDE